MKEKEFTEHLISFGLTRQEAVIYHHLLQVGKQTGYETAKQTGVSRSNTYNALASLVEKGAAYVVEESARKYIPVGVEEFCENGIARLRREKEWLVLHTPGTSREEEGYITIEGQKHIQDKVERLLEKAEKRVYISCSAKRLTELEAPLQKLVESGKKVVIITDRPREFEGAAVYVTEEKGSRIGIITDSRYVLTGEYGEESGNTCLYSGQKNFVELFKNALANEIKLIQYMKGRQNE